MTIKTHTVNDNKLFFLISIDTEGDNLWSKPRQITTHNASFLSRFQSLCELYKLKPTYFVNYEMAISPVFQDIGKDISRRDAGEIGMHLHAWNSPPSYNLTGDDYNFQPYLLEYPPEVIELKISFMTNLLEDIFNTRIISHRAGRWGLNSFYARMLVENGYHIDGSVTPSISWQSSLGDPSRNGGPDYTHFPDQAYFIDLDDISKPGQSPLLEIPMTIIKRHNIKNRFFNYLFRPVSWLRPNGKNLRDMLAILNQTTIEKRNYVQMMLHSSELMPGGSSIFPNQQAIDSLYSDLETIFLTAEKKYIGSTYKEYWQYIINNEK